MRADRGEEKVPSPGHWWAISPPLIIISIIDPLIQGKGIAPLDLPELQVV